MIVFLACSLKASAQESFLGKKEGYIKDLLYKNNYIQLGQKTSNGTITQLKFGYFDTSKHDDYNKIHNSSADIPNNTTPTATLTCILENDTCSKYIVSYMPENVPGILNYLNKKYKKTDNNHWVDQKGLYEAGAYNVGEAFAIEFKKIDNN